MPDESEIASTPLPEFTPCGDASMLLPEFPPYAVEPVAPIRAVKQSESGAGSAVAANLKNPVCG